MAFWLADLERQWLAKPDVILKTLFPQELAADEYQILKQDLLDLNESKYSVLAFHGEIMANWAQDDGVKVVRTEDYLARLVAKVDELVANIPQ